MNVDDALATPGETLFPPRAARKHLDDWLTAALADAQERVVHGSVMPTLDMARFREELSGFKFEHPRPIEELLSWTVTQLQHGMVHMTHPHYFGLFNPAPNFPSQCADRIAGAFNPQLASSGSSPAPVEIEMHLIRAIAQRAGFPASATGHFTVSGSEANSTALVCAMTRLNPQFASLGVRAFAGPVAMYASRDCHAAWHKIVHQAGIGRAALRLVRTDGHGRMDSDALADAVATDQRQGITPVLICATAGTTSGGMIDPLAASWQIAQHYGTWCHIDAAWGGAALCSERMRSLLAGVELADSVTIDAHKWFATTMACGMFITRHAAVLSEAFRVSADFMPSSVPNLDPYLNTMQWSRRFMGLRLFLALGAAGWTGYSAHVERAVDVIAIVKLRLVAHGWRVENDSPLAVLCLTPPAGPAVCREIVRKVLSSGRAWVAVATFEGRETIRICATHGETTLADIDELVSTLQASLSPATVGVPPD